MVIESGNCDPLLTIRGSLTTPDSQIIQNAMVNVFDTGGLLPVASVTTTSSGEFSLAGFPWNTELRIQPTKTEDVSNGVNVIDLLRMYQAILGDELSTPYFKIAADVNKDGLINIQDLMVLRQLTLGAISVMPNTDSWTFIDKSCTPTLDDPFSCLSYVDTNPSNWEVITDFFGIKMGDLTGDANPSGYSSVNDRTFGKLTLNTSDRVLHAGEEVAVTLKANRDDILAYQFTLGLGAMEFIDVVGSDVSFDKNFALHDGALTTSWFGELSNKEVFTVTLKATKDTRLSRELSINSRITQSMAFDTDEQKQAIKLSFDGKTKSLFDLYQNEPNPFSNSTNIQFFLPESTMATLTVYNTNGQILKTVKGEYPKGMNQVSFAKADWKATGILYYKLATEFGTKVKRMVIVE